MNIIISLLVFTVIIVIHELGHFLLAKKNGIGVTEFSVGMGPRIVTIVKTKKGFTCKFFASQGYCEKREDWKDITRYSWKIFPIGGSCMMLGEDEVLEDDKAFNKKGVWAKISVIAAGPIFNCLLAFLLAMIIIGSVGYNPAKVSGVKAGSSAEAAGIQKGDVITSINGSKVQIGSDLSIYLQFQPLKGDEVKLTYKRAEEQKEAIIDPNYQTYMLGLGCEGTSHTAPAKVVEVSEGGASELAGLKVGDIIKSIDGTAIETDAQWSEYISGLSLTQASVSVVYERDGVEKEVSITPKSYEGKALGFSIASGFDMENGREKTGVLGVLKYSAIEVKFWITTTVKSLGQMIRGKVSMDDISGPVGIVAMIGDSYEVSKSGGLGLIFLNLFNIGILLSANLGVMNLLPIPALDGGRLIFLFLEAIRGKAISQEKEGMVHLVGLVALMILMVFVAFNDIARLF